MIIPSDDFSYTEGRFICLEHFAVYTHTCKAFKLSRRFVKIHHNRIVKFSMSAVSLDR